MEKGREGETREGKEIRLNMPETALVYPGHGCTRGSQVAVAPARFASWAIITCVPVGHDHLSVNRRSKGKVPWLQIRLS